MGGCVVDGYVWWVGTLIVKRGKELGERKMNTRGKTLFTRKQGSNNTLLFTNHIIKTRIISKRTLGSHRTTNGSSRRLTKDGCVGQHDFPIKIPAERVEHTRKMG